MQVTLRRISNVDVSKELLVPFRRKVFNFNDFRLAFSWISCVDKPANHTSLNIILVEQVIFCENL